jgi:hypothetical protein
VSESFERQLSENTDGVLTDLVGHPAVIIAFGSLAHDPRKSAMGIPAFEFFKQLQGMAVDKVFVRDPARSFYHRPIEGLGATIPEMEETLRGFTGAAERVIVVGASAGGYAALLFGTLLRADSILAFSPITYLDRLHRLRHLERRWRAEIDPINRGPSAQRRYLDVRRVMKANPPDGGVTVFHGGKLRIDRIHAERMRSIPNVDVRELRGVGGHEVAKTLRDRGELLPLLQAAVTGGL